MGTERERDEWTEDDERHPERREEPMPVQEEGLAVGLEAVDETDPDIDPEIAEEVRVQEETREAEGDEGPVETVLNFRDEEDEAD